MKWPTLCQVHILYKYWSLGSYERWVCAIFITWFMCFMFSLNVAFHSIVRKYILGNFYFLLAQQHSNTLVLWSQQLFIPFALINFFVWMRHSILFFSNLLWRFLSILTQQHSIPCVCLIPKMEQCTKTKKRACKALSPEPNCSNEKAGLWI